MPTLVTGLVQQEQAAAASATSYPQMPNSGLNWRYTDEFTRESLNPTNAYALYATSAVGAGSVAVAELRQLEINTEAGIGSEATCRISGFGFQRQSSSTVLANRTTIKTRIVFFPDSVTDTNSEIFVGLVNNTAALTALPGSATRGMGIRLNTASSANWFLWSSNGSAEVTTDTATAATNQPHRVDITWSGDDAGLIEFFDDEDSATPTSSVTVSSLVIGDQGLQLNFYVNPLNAEGKSLIIQEWDMEST